MDNNLKRTLIIPDDESLAGDLFNHALNDLDVVLFVVLGKTHADLIKLVDWRARALPTRQAVWILNPELASLKDFVAKMRSGDSSIVAVVFNKADKMVVRLKAGDPQDPLAVETAFSNAEGTW